MRTGRRVRLQPKKRLGDLRTRRKSARTGAAFLVAWFPCFILHVFARGNKLPILLNARLTGVLNDLATWQGFRDRRGCLWRSNPLPAVLPTLGLCVSPPLRGRVYAPFRLTAGPVFISIQFQSETHGCSKTIPGAGIPSGCRPSRRRIVQRPEGVGGRGDRPAAGA